MSIGEITVNLMATLVATYAGSIILGGMLMEVSEKFSKLVDSFTFKQAASFIIAYGSVLWIPMIIYLIYKLIEAFIFGLKTPFQMININQLKEMMPKIFALKEDEQKMLNKIKELIEKGYKLEKVIDVFYLRTPNSTRDFILKIDWCEAGFDNCHYMWLVGNRSNTKDVSKKFVKELNNLIPKKDAMKEFDDKFFNLG